LPINCQHGSDNDGRLAVAAVSTAAPLNRLDDFLIATTTTVPWADGCAERLLERHKVIPNKFRHLPQPSTFAARQDDDRLPLYGIPYKIEAVLLRRQSKPSMTVSMGRVREEFDGQDGLGNCPGTEVRDEVFQFVFPPLSVAPTDVWSKKGKGGI